MRSKFNDCDIVTICDIATICDISRSSYKKTSRISDDVIHDIFYK